MAERRTEPRKILLARVEVQWESPTGTSNIAAAMIEDTSRSGMCIRIKKSIPVGSKLQIKWRNEDILGIVRNSRKDGFQYVLGIQRESL